MVDVRYAIIGGGIVGASVAYHISERTDDSVVVYERNDLASETTFRATAMIGVAGPDPYHRMKEYGFRLYNEFFAEPTASPQYRQSGRLRVATSNSGARALRNAASAYSGMSQGAETVTRDVEKYANSLVEYVAGDELTGRFLVPSLETTSIEGALYRPQYGYIQDDSRTFGPRELAMEFVERARDNGVRFETGTAVTDIGVKNESVRSIKTRGGATIQTDTVVCAAGPWNDRVASRAGLDLPLEHVPSPVFAMQLTDPLPYSLPMIKSHESSVGLHPKRDDIVLVTYTPDKEERQLGPDLATMDDTAPEEYRTTALRWAEQLMPQLKDAELIDEWAGVGTSTPDGKPIVGWTHIDGLALAVTRAGIQYAPAVGSIVARQLVEENLTEYYDAVSISRFDGYSDQRISDDSN